MKRWQPDFIPPLVIVNSTLVYIRLLGLSMVYYDDNALRANSSYVGCPVKIDSNTTLTTQRKFVRICVEVDLTKPLIGGIMLDGHW